MDWFLIVGADVLIGPRWFFRKRAAGDMAQATLSCPVGAIHLVGPYTHASGLFVRAAPTARRTRRILNVALAKTHLRTKRTRGRRWSIRLCAPVGERSTTGPAAGFFKGRPAP